MHARGRIIAATARLLRALTTGRVPSQVAAAPRAADHAARRHPRALASVATLVALSVLGGTAVAGVSVVTVGEPAMAALYGGFEIDGDMQAGTEGGIDWSSPELAPQPRAIDPLGSSADTYFAGGSNAVNAPSQTLTTGKISPAANDIGNVYGHSAFVDHSQWLYIGFERAVASGTMTFQFELSQLPSAVNAAGYEMPVRSVGDLLIIGTYSGSGFAVDGAHAWDGSGWIAQPIAADSPVHAASNTSTITTLDERTLTAGLFGEVAINLSALLSTPSCPGVEASTLAVRNATGGSINSALREYVEPFEIGLDDECGDLTIRKVDEAASPVARASFTVAPDPTPLSTAASLAITDGGAGDADGVADGTLTLGDARPGVTYTITETAAPPVTSSMRRRRPSRSTTAVRTRSTS
ncbi:hypothetical protein [Microbacterium sediminis]|uniref:Uncharacterized protein n=1 Tax=Microbacterium sediminis TaxID=904291 RepID=A0A1B9NAH5_9MICO|nr:hypothetical protein [Microbacterium sediminis]OCG73587.1 hypothetical protein A7J15_07905 [Microbacterium sediminis]QBR73266.1 hypothetical protein E3O41_01630 [Microbacterium sediminis]